jgi:hypothetical protein
MFNFLSFVMQRLQLQEELQVRSRHRVLVFVLLSTSTACLNLNGWGHLFHIAIHMPSALEHCIFKASPDWQHEDLNLVDKVVHT